MLERSRPDYQVDGAVRLEEAIALAQHYRFDVVLLDLNLPDSDGLATVEQFVSAVHLPTIILTVQDDEALALQAINKGAQDYLIKDEISPEMLVRSIRYSIERGRLISQIQAANAELEAFSYSAAHDLKSPLRGIVGFADILLADDEEIVINAVAEGYVRSIRSSALCMSTLINDLLVYSRVSTDRMPLTAVDLSDSISGALAQLQADIDQSQATVIVDAPFPQVVGHAAMLQQAIANLVGNAIKFIEPDTLPKVRLWAEERLWHGKPRVRLWVVDNGIGIAPQHREQIFQVFERLNRHEKYSGSGIGLAITQKAVHRMEGVLGVESRVNQGSQFWLELPKA